MTMQCECLRTQTLRNQRYQHKVDVTVGGKRGSWELLANQMCLENCRCPCARKGEPCKDICRCKDCSNRNGKRPSSSLTRVRESYSQQAQSLSGRRGSDFLKVMNEEHTDGSLSKLERLLMFAILVHFMLHGCDITSENVHCAFLDIWEIASECTFIELPIFKRSQQYIAKYLQSAHNTLSLFFQIHGNCSS